MSETERPSKRRKIMCLKPRKLQTTSDGGDFDKISLEVLYLILDKLSLKDVSYKKKKKNQSIFIMIYFLHFNHYFLRSDYWLWRRKFFVSKFMNGCSLIIVTVKEPNHLKKSLLLVTNWKQLHRQEPSFCQHFKMTSNAGF